MNRKTSVDDIGKYGLTAGATAMRDLSRLYPAPSGYVGFQPRLAGWHSGRACLFPAPTNGGDGACRRRVRPRSGRV